MQYVDLVRMGKKLGRIFHIDDQDTVSFRTHRILTLYILFILPFILDLAFRPCCRLGKPLYYSSQIDPQRRRPTSRESAWILLC